MNLKKKIRKIIRAIQLFFIKERYNSKVFCIGFNKTGTTTIGKSLEILGYRNSSFNPKIWKLYKSGDIEKVLKYTAKFDSCDDLPWLKIEMIPILDKTFPNSKFIYLERDEDDWKKSYSEWTELKTSTKPDIEKAFLAFNNHKFFVKDYFKNRENDILILDVSDSKGFEKLANFLNKKASQDNFPHFNKTEEFRASITRK
ncbi:MAG: sulfotransferase [Bacteroidia bacterium]